MSMIKKLLKTAHAVSYMPLRRHGWRVLRRGQRKLNGRKPGPRYAALLGRAEALDWAPTVLADFAATRLAHETACATDGALRGDGRIDVTIHGVTAPVTPARPYADIPEDLPYLWQMSLGYLGYMLPACASGDAAAGRAFVDLAAGFADEASWAASKAHDRHWHPYSASHRVINMIAGRQFLAAHMSDADLAPLDRAIRLCTQLISESTEYDIHYNHLTKNLMALMISEAFRTGQVSAARFDEYRAAAEYQVLPDGGHAELCPMYHAQFLADLLVIGALPAGAMAPGMADWLAGITARMQGALRLMSHPDGDVALFGDSWRGEAPASAILAPGGYDTPESAARETLPDTGYTRLRGGAFCAIIDHGHIGADDNPGHAHDDALSVEVAVDGQRVVLDYGVESYTAGPGRDRSRGRAWHNAPSFEGDRGLDGWGAFRVGKRTKPPLWSHGARDGWVWLQGQRFSLGHDAPTTERLLLLHPAHGVVIRDRWLSTPGQAHFLLAADAAVQLAVVQGAAAPDETAEAFALFGHPGPAVARDITPRTGPEGHETVVVLGTPNGDPAASAASALDAFSKGSEISQ